MSDVIENQGSNASSRADHMANERTFLAWVRTSMGIMAFGFVVEKFALFVKQLALLLGKSQFPIASSTPPPIPGYSSIFGIFLVAFGVLLCVLAFIKYKQIEKQIEDDTYHPSAMLNIILTAAVVVIGIFLIIYLYGSI